MSFWNRANTISIILITALFVQGQQPDQQNTSPAAASPATIEGTWSATTLLLKGAPIPGGYGQFLEFGQVYATDSFIAFWARTGPNPEKDWALFSWKDGHLSRVVQRSVEFLAPDERKVTFGAGIPVHAGNHLLYFSSVYPHHIYAWDGEKLVKVLSKGDQLQFGNETYTINRSRVLDIVPGGKALIAFSSRSQSTSGWAVHDGSGFTVLLMRHVVSSKLVEYQCLEKWDEMGYWTLRLLDGVLGLQRSSDGQSLTIGNPKELCETLRQESFFRVEHGSVSLYPFHLKGEEWVTYNGSATIAPGSQYSLGAEVSVEWHMSSRNKLRSRPQLYLWTGKELSSVAWEDSVGLSGDEVPVLLERTPRTFDQGSDEIEGSGTVAHIELRAIPGPIGGASVRLPDLGGKQRTWYVPGNSTDGKLQQPPRFPVAEHVIGLADLISWKENEVLALNDEGLFRLVRIDK